MNTNKMCSSNKFAKWGNLSSSNDWLHVLYVQLSAWLQYGRFLMLFGGSCISDDMHLHIYRSFLQNAVEDVNLTSVDYNTSICIHELIQNPKDETDYYGVQTEQKRNLHECKQKVILSISTVNLLYWNIIWYFGPDAMYWHSTNCNNI